MDIPKPKYKIGDIVVTKWFRNDRPNTTLMATISYAEYLNDYWKYRFRECTFESIEDEIIYNLSEK